MAAVTRVVSREGLEPFNRLARGHGPARTTGYTGSHKGVPAWQAMYDAIVLVAGMNGSTSGGRTRTAAHHKDGGMTS
jgi:hypothetical protein